MAELDTLLGRFLETEYARLTPLEISHFEAILELPDPELYGYLLGRATHPNPDLAALIQRLCDNPGP